MEVVHTPNGTVAKVTEALITAQVAAEKDAATKGEKAAVDATFSAIQTVLDAHPRDAQASVTAQIHTTPKSTKVYVDITVVPSAAATAAALAESEGVPLAAIGGQTADAEVTEETAVAL